jgi:nicotinamidase/pyrazinamidase
MYFQITELAKHLYTRHIETVIIVGLAADYCVKESALDARKFGFRTILVKDGTKPAVPENFDTCMSALAAKKVEIVGSNDEAFKAELLK